MKRNDLAIYDTYAPNWWDGSQRFLRLLHNIVPARMKYFSTVVGGWNKKRVLDLGCGGGFMSEALAKQGAQVIGVDPSKPAIDAAKEHARSGGLAIDYRVGSAESIPIHDHYLDCVICVDVLEHVDDLDLSLNEIRRVLRVGGLFLFDTINRTPLASLVLIHFGETILRLLPSGTHDPDKFIKPVEIRSKLHQRGFEVGPFVGLGPRGINQRFDFTFGRLPSVQIMYMGHACAGAAIGR